MGPLDQIAALRAAAAKLAEALAYTGTSPNGAAAIVSEAEELAGGHLTPQGEGIGLFSNWRDHYNSFYGGWRWIVETARLRLLEEALLLEQEARQEPAEFAGDARIVRTQDDAELGALVREWWGGVNRG